MLSCINTFRGHTDRVWCVAWHPHLSVVGSCSSDKCIRLWNVDDEDVDALKPKNSNCKAVFGESAHQRTIRYICWSFDGHRLAAASFDGTISIWMFDEEEEDWICINVIQGHENEAKCVAWHPSSLFIATCSRDKTVWIHEAVEAAASEGGPRGSSEFFCAAVLSGHTQDVKTVKWHPTKDVVMSASYDDSIRVWARVGDDWGHIQTLMGHTSTVWCISFNPSGTLFASCSDDKTVKIWKSASKGVSRPLKDEAVRRLSQTVKTSHMTGPFRDVMRRHVEDTEEEATAMDGWRCVATIHGYHERSIYCVDWHPRDDVIATACGDNGLRIFKYQNHNTEGCTWTLVSHKPNAHGSDINSVNWKPHPEEDGSYLLATAGDDDYVKIWRYKDVDEGGLSEA